IGLQLGCSSDCYETELLSKILYKLDVIEGSSINIERCQKKNLPNVRFFNSLFEEFKVIIDKEKYDFIFCTYVLEHVIDVQPILNMIKSVLNSKGFVFFVVPNCRACSRQLALYMNLIPGLRELTENDLIHGHRRVYDRFSFNKDIEKAGFRIIQQGGIIFKILADFQLDELIEKRVLNKSHFKGLYKLGLEYPDFCDSLYAICCLKKN
ncbi:MAG: class I SAM-dependent methyltransferase, partial [Candidatus Lokiarchaeia archaeon]